MKIIGSIILCCLLILSSPHRAGAKEWRGIVPLKSTRADVERMLGRSPDVVPKYDLPDEIVYIYYAHFPCGHKNPPGWPVAPPGWNVPKDTVVAVSVMPKKSVPLSRLAFDLSKFERARGDHDVPQHFRYVNEQEGFSIEVFDFGEERGEVVSAYGYFPTAEEEEIFRCKELK